MPFANVQGTHQIRQAFVRRGGGANHLTRKLIDYYIFIDEIYFIDLFYIFKSREFYLANFGERHLENGEVFCRFCGCFL